MPNHDPPGVKANGKPQPLDPAKVKASVARTRELVLALVADRTGDEYRRVLERVTDEAFEGVETDQQFIDRLAYVMYGSAIFGLTALLLAEELGKKSREQVLSMLDRGVDLWLQSSTG